MATNRSIKKSADKWQNLIEILQNRFEKNRLRHPDFAWNDVNDKLITSLDKLAILSRMEETGGEPDVVGFDKKSETFIFFDCATESPVGRRGLCYDHEGFLSRKENRPSGNVIDQARELGIQLLNEEDYRYLQTLGDFDLKTSSWILTPAPIRKLGGALFCDKRYGAVFTYHNGAQSYYSSRGFRGRLEV